MIFINHISGTGKAAVKGAFAFPDFLSHAARASDGTLGIFAPISPHTVDGAILLVAAAAFVRFAVTFFSAVFRRITGSLPTLLPAPAGSGTDGPPRPLRPFAVDRTRSESAVLLFHR